jgi:hypothetical protein
MIIDNLEQLPDMFKDGVRGVMLLHRNKDGCIGNAQRKSIKRISMGKNDWYNTIQYFASLRNGEYQNFRIYSSVNSRNMDKAIHEFKRRQLENDRNADSLRDSFYNDIENNFFSCLMNPSCRIQNNFLIDCDTGKEYLHALPRIPNEKIIYEYPTKNGHHIITEPFNPVGLEMEIKKDDLIYIG